MTCLPMTRVWGRREAIWGEQLGFQSVCGLDSQSREQYRCPVQGLISFIVLVIVPGTSGVWGKHSTIDTPGPDSRFDQIL